MDPDPNDPDLIYLTLQQHFEIMATVFYVDAAPLDYTAFDDA